MATKRTTARWNRQKTLAAYMKKQVKAGNAVFLIVLDDGRRYLLSGYLFINVDGVNRLPEGFGGMDLGTMLRAEPGAYRINDIDHVRLPDTDGKARQRFIEGLLGKALLVNLTPTPLLTPVRGPLAMVDMARLFLMHLPQSPNQSEARLVLADAELVGLFSDDPLAMTGMRYDLLENGAIRVYHTGRANERQDILGILMTMNMTKGETPEHLANPLAYAYLTDAERARAFEVAYSDYLELQRQVVAERDRLKEQEAALAEALVKQGVPAQDAARSAAVAAGAEA